jgi:bacteriocin-like protein
MPTSNTIDRELTETKRDVSNELRDEELEQVIGGSLSPFFVTMRMDKASPGFFK